MGGGQFCLCVSLFPGEKGKHINKIPRKSQEKAGTVPGLSRDNPGTIPWKFCLCVFLFIGFFPALQLDAPNLRRLSLQTQDSRLKSPESSTESMLSGRLIFIYASSAGRCCLIKNVRRLNIGDRKSLPIAKNHPKTSQEFSEQFGPATHKIKGFSKNSLQKVHPNFAKNLGRQILGNTFSDPPKKITSTSTERQKRSQNLAPVLAIISGNSLVFSRRIINSTVFYRCCAAGASAPVVVQNLSPKCLLFSASGV